MTGAGNRVFFYCLFLLIMYNNGKRLHITTYTHTGKGGELKTVAIINRKGGIGKTTTAQMMGAGLQRRGYSVLYVDLDSQANLTFALGVPSGHGCMNLLLGIREPKDVIKHTDQGDIIPAGEDLATADSVLKSEYLLKAALESVSSIYDYAIIDTPAALGRLTANALTAADTAIITAQPETYSLLGINLLYNLINAVKSHSNRKLEVRGVLLTRYNSTTISKDMRDNMESFAKKLGTKVFSTVIRENTKIKECQFVRQDIFTYSPRSNGAIDYNNFVEEFLEGDGQ